MLVAEASIEPLIEVLRTAYRGPYVEPLIEVLPAHKAGEPLRLVVDLPRLSGLALLRERRVLRHKQVELLLQQRLRLNRHVAAQLSAIARASNFTCPCHCHSLIV